MGVRPTDNSTQYTYMVDTMHEREEAPRTRASMLRAREETARMRVDTQRPSAQEVQKAHVRAKRINVYNPPAQDGDWKLVATSGNKLHAPGSRAYVQPILSHRTSEQSHQTRASDDEDVLADEEFSNEVFSGDDAVYAEHVGSLR